MTFDDMQTIEACVAALVPMGEERPPVMRDLTYDRVEVDLSKWEAAHRQALRSSLERELNNLGHPEWEAWFFGNSTMALFVSEKDEP